MDRFYEEFPDGLHLGCEAENGVNKTIKVLHPDEPLQCGGCTKCCEFGLVFIEPEEYDKGYDTQVAVDPETGEIGQRLSYKEGTTTCVYLGSEGCTIYAKRPNVCRQFDCRIMYVSIVLANVQGDMAVVGKNIRDAVERGRDLLITEIEQKSGMSVEDEGLDWIPQHEHERAQTDRKSIKKL